MDGGGTNVGPRGTNVGPTWDQRGTNVGPGDFPVELGQKNLGKCFPSENKVSKFFEKL